MMKKTFVNFKNVILIFIVILFTHNAFALKLNLKGITDVIDKVAEEIDDKVNNNKTDEINSNNNEEAQNKVVQEKSEDTIAELVLVEIDENISDVKTKDLKKLKTIDMERLLFGTASLGFYENGDIFEDIHSPNSSDQKGEYKSILNESQEFKGVYKIAQSKICYLIDGTDDWQCAVLYKHKKLDGIYYWGLKGKIFAKIVKVMDIPAYDKMKFDNSEAEKARREEEIRKAEEKRIADKKVAEEKRIAEDKQKEKEDKKKALKLEKQLRLLTPDNELTIAQNFIIDVNIYFENNKDEFDVFKIAKFLNLMKPISEGHFDNAHKEDFILFSNYINESQSFIDFHNQQLIIRKNKKLSIIDDSINLLENNIKNLKKYLEDNINSDFTLSIIDEIKSAKLVLDSPESINQIKDKNENLSSLITNINQAENKAKEFKILLDKELKNANDNIFTLKSYLQENIKSDFAPEIIEKVETIEKIISKNNLNELIEINNNVSQFIKKNNLISQSEIIAKQKEKDQQWELELKLDPFEQLKLGYKYYNGDGVAKNLRKSALLWESAAQKGLAQAQLEIGESYRYGEGVNKDLSLAYMWISNSIIEFFVIRGSVVKNSHRKEEYMLDESLISEVKGVLSDLYGSMPSSDMIAGTGLANTCWKNKFKNCGSNHLTYSEETEQKVLSSGLPMCPEDDPNKLYQVKWDNCFGIQTFDNGIYEGEYTEGNFHGIGTYIWNSGDKYVGEWVEHRIEGFGSLFFANGDIYEGMFMDGAFEGVGKYINSNGVIEEGIWKNNELTENKKTNKLVNINKEYVALKNANVREEPYVESQIVTTIEKGTTVLVLKKTENNDWFLIKEIKENWGNEDIGEILGYSSADLYQSVDFLNTGNSNSVDSDSHSYSAPPGQLLTNAYLNYIAIKKMYEARQGYAVVYINDVQMTKSKNQVKEIEKTLLSKFELDEDLIWNIANKKYKKDYGSIDLVTSTGIYTDDGSRLAKMLTLSLDSIAEEVIEQNQDKDF